MTRLSTLFLYFLSRSQLTQSVFHSHYPIDFSTQNVTGVLVAKYNGLFLVLFLLVKIKCENTLFHYKLKVLIKL